MYMLLPGMYDFIGAHGPGKETRWCRNYQVHEHDYRALTGKVLWAVYEEIKV